MREIKFEYLIVFKPNKKVLKKYIFTIEDIENGKASFALASNTFIVKRQYTGLKDKNGVEIYEWDIVKGTKENEHQGQSQVFIDNWSIQPFSYLGCYEANLFEVIGNIYENKELLGDN